MAGKTIKMKRDDNINSGSDLSVPEFYFITLRVSFDPSPAN